MPNQINYYNQFGKEFGESILTCTEPEIWTTDYTEKGRVYQEMKQRVQHQHELILKYFKRDQPVLDIGCGFGRQALVLAREGFAVTGTDTSDVFIEIARKLFAKFNYKGEFICGNINSEDLLNRKFSQVILFDVLEHIPAGQRKKFLEKIHSLTLSGGILLVSLPHVKKRLSSQLNNMIRRRVTQYSSYFLNREEHPYPIPQKRHMDRLVKNLFSLDKFAEGADSDYYVFRRL